jgi:hypothetical protein
MFLKNRDLIPEIATCAILTGLGLYISWRQMVFMTVVTLVWTYIERSPLGLVKPLSPAQCARMEERLCELREAMQPKNREEEAQQAAAERKDSHPDAPKEEAPVR